MMSIDLRHCICTLNFPILAFLTVSAVTTLGDLKENISCLKLLYLKDSTETSPPTNGWEIYQSSTISWERDEYHFIQII